MWIEYYYDATGIRGMLYNGTQYYFEKNMQGDVVAIYHMNGNIRGTYVYDAYGNCTATSIGGSIATEANPFRYRGYYRDAETSFTSITHRTSLTPLTQKYEKTLKNNGIGTILHII